MNLRLIPPQIFVPGLGPAVEDPFNDHHGQEAHRNEREEAQKRREDRRQIRRGADVLEEEGLREEFMSNSNSNIHRECAEQRYVSYVSFE